MSITVFKKGGENGLHCELCNVVVEKDTRSIVVREASRKGCQNMLRYHCEIMVSKNCTKNPGDTHNIPHTNLNIVLWHSVE